MAKEKTGGRQIGTPNKTTKETREILKVVVCDEIQKIPELIKRLTDKERIEVIIKLLPYILPKIQSETYEQTEPRIHDSILKRIRLPTDLLMEEEGIERKELDEYISDKNEFLDWRNRKLIF